MLLNEQSPNNRLIDVTVNELMPLLPMMMVAEVSLSQAAEEKSTGTFVQALKNACGTVSRLWKGRLLAYHQMHLRQEWRLACPIGFARCYTICALKAAWHT